MGTEVELKLLFDPAAVRSIARWVGWQSRKIARARRQSLLSVYFDTPDLQLEAAGAALRLREAGPRWMQTLKLGGNAAGGVHTRTEREWPVAGQAIELQHLRSLHLGRSLKHVEWSALKPVFTTRFERTAFAITLGAGGTAEVAIDLGRVEAGARTEPIAEIEVELAAASAAGVTALFDLASELVAVLPVRLGAQSKAERGYTLARRQPPHPVKARSVALDVKAPAGAAARIVLGECLAQIQANEIGFLHRSDPEYLHQMRVGLRRLKAALGCFRALIPEPELVALKVELRWLGAALGAARDWDVWCADTFPRMLEWLAHSRDEHSAATTRAFQTTRALQPIGARALGQRRKARRAARTAVASPRYAQLLIRCARLSVTIGEAQDAAVSLREFAATVLSRRHAALVDKAVAEPHAEALHTLRLAAKKLRYSTEFFRALGGSKRTARYVAALARLQDILGPINDAAVAARLLDAASDVPPRTRDANHEAAVAMLRGWLGGIESVHLEAVPSALQACLDCKRFW